MEKYKNYLKSSLLAKITLGLIVLILCLGIYCLLKVWAYLPTYMAFIAVIAFIVLLAILVAIHYSHPKISVVLEVLLIICMVMGTLVITRVDDVVTNIVDTTEYETVDIVALKDSDITADSSFDDMVLAYVQDDEDGYIRSTEILKENNRVVKKEKPYKSTEKAYKALLNEKVDLLVLDNLTKSDLSEIDENYTDKIKVILTKEYVIESAKAKDIDITSEPFTIYLQGADLSSGNNINSTGRGDVNILLTINPNTKQVNLQVIPRDLFVYIACRGGKSKLSYSGWWGGVQSSIQSIEEVFDVDINYYVKINFDGLTELVDALDGVTVYSHYTYEAGGYQFTEGYNEVDGDKALIFARARKMLPLNERSRGFQQMELIKGIFTKFAQEPSYNHAMSVIDSLESNFTTNLPKSKFLDAYQVVIDLLPQLQTMENHSIEGEYKWHYDEIRPSYYQYYFYPAEGEVEAVKERINKVLEGK